MKPYRQAHEPVPEPRWVAFGYTIALAFSILVWAIVIYFVIWAVG